MADELKPYPEYKPSGLRWLPRMPAHWEVRRTGRLFSQRNETGFPELPILEVSLKTGVRIRDVANGERKQMMADRAKYKRAVQGDIAYNMMRLWQGAVGVAPVDGLVSPAYVVARPHAEVDSRYYAYLFRTAVYMNEVNKYSHGIVSDRNRLYWDEFKQMPSIFPPPAEQKTIATYLDNQAALVARFIRNKRRLIDLLNDERRARIDNAVTQGLSKVRGRKIHLDPWLGSVPEDWEIYKIKQVARLNPSKSESSGTPETMAVFLPMERVSTDGIVDCSERRPLSELWNGYTYFRRHDVLMAKITPCFENGKGAYLGELASDIGFGTTEFVVLRASDKVKPKFLYLLTQTRGFRSRGAEHMTGSAGQKRVPSEFIKNYPLALPGLAEQQEIIDYAEQVSRANEAHIRRAQREIELIREYRARLVADVVTGKLDVRGVSLSAEQFLPEPDAAAEPDEISEEVSPEDGLAEEVAIGDE